MSNFTRFLHKDDNFSLKKGDRVHPSCFIHNYLWKINPKVRDVLILNIKMKRKAKSLHWIIILHVMPSLCIYWSWIRNDIRVQILSNGERMQNMAINSADPVKRLLFFLLFLSDIKSSAVLKETTFYDSINSINFNQRKEFSFSRNIKLYIN